MGFVMDCLCSVVVLWSFWTNFVIVFFVVGMVVSDGFWAVAIIVRNFLRDSVRCARSVAILGLVSCWWG